MECDSIEVYVCVYIFRKADTQKNNFSLLEGQHVLI